MANEIDRCVVVTRKTQLQELLLRHNTIDQAKFYLQAAGADISIITARHETYVAAVERLKGSLPRSLKQAVIDRSYLPQFDFQDDMVFAIGQDGLVSNTAKYLTTQPLIGVNPDPANIEGVLLPWRAEQVEALIGKVKAQKYNAELVTLAEARLNDGRKLLAFNDFFIGQSGHASALYTIFSGQKSEFQSSSGIIVSTGAGSTGWLKSVYKGASEIMVSSISTVGNFQLAPPDALPRVADRLRFAVREPWPSKNTGSTVVSGDVTHSNPLRIESRMPSNGVIFSDGIEWDFLEFNSGSSAEISIADHKAILVVP
jgi:NAD kinase